ncbi:MAG: phospholipase D-like domain-containing protein [Chloroflexota bacterium]
MLAIYQTPEQQVLPILLDALAKAERSIDLLMYGFDHPDLCAALCAAAHRGVQVRGIFDHLQSCNRHQLLCLHRLMLGIGAGAVRIGTSPQHRIMHRKTCLIDGAIVLTGSYNRTVPAQRESNDLVVIGDGAIAAQVQVEFNSLWQWITVNEPAYSQLLEKTTWTSPT